MLLGRRNRAALAAATALILATCSREADRAAQFTPDQQHAQATAQADPKATLTGWRSIRFGMPISQATQLEGGFSSQGSVYDGAATIDGETYTVRLVPFHDTVEMISIIPMAMEMLSADGCLDFVKKALPAMKAQYGPPDEVTPAEEKTTGVEAPRYTWRFKDGHEITLHAYYDYFQKCEASASYTQPVQQQAPSSF